MAAAVLLMVSACGGDPLVPLEAGRAPVLPRKIAMTIENYCPQLNYRYADFLLYNASLRTDGDGGLLVDFDRDGLADKYDDAAQFNLSLMEKDTNKDGYGDLVVSRLGISRAHQNLLPKCPAREQDTDGDGFTDCDEILALTDPLRMDTDGDGLPDEIEVREGLNPSIKSDAEGDLDGDDIANKREIQLHTPVNFFNTHEVSELAYQYELSPKSIAEKQCFDFTVSNITLANVANGNLVRFFFTERKTDGTPDMRMAVVVVPNNTTDGASLKFNFSDLMKVGS